MNSWSSLKRTFSNVFSPPKDLTQMDVRRAPVHVVKLKSSSCLLDVDLTNGHVFIANAHPPLPPKTTVPNCSQNSLDSASTWGKSHPFLQSGDTITDATANCSPHVDTFNPPAKKSKRGQGRKSIGQSMAQCSRVLRRMVAAQIHVRCDRARFSRDKSSARPPDQDTMDEIWEEYQEFLALARDWQNDEFTFDAFVYMSCPAK